MDPDCQNGSGGSSFGAFIVGLGSIFGLGFVSRHREDD